MGWRRHDDKESIDIQELEMRTDRMKESCLGLDETEKGNTSWALGKSNQKHENEMDEQNRWMGLARSTGAAQRSSEWTTSLAKQMVQ